MKKSFKKRNGEAKSKHIVREKVNEDQPSDGIGRYQPLGMIPGPRSKQPCDILYIFTFDLSVFHTQKSFVKLFEHHF